MRVVEPLTVLLVLALVVLFAVKLEKWVARVQVTARSSSWRRIPRVGPAIFYFTVVVVVVHGLLLFGAGWAVGLDLPTLAVASQANVEGPASAMALATARAIRASCCRVSPWA